MLEGKDEHHMSDIHIHHPIIKHTQWENHWWSVIKAYTSVNPLTRSQGTLADHAIDIMEMTTQALTIQLLE